MMRYMRVMPFSPLSQGARLWITKKNLMLRSAVERQFEIIGESLNLAETNSPELAERIPDLRRIVGMRNRIIHGYDSVDDELLWQTVQTHVGALARQIAKILDSETD